MGSSQAAWKSTTTVLLPRFCDAAVLAARLGLPVEFIDAETEARHLCYIEVDGTKLYNVDIAAQEIMHTGRLSHPPNYMSSVPWVVCPRCRVCGDEVEGRVGDDV